jgi:hypothetical protein
MPETPIAGWWGANTVDAGLAVASVRGFARPDIIAVNLDDQDGNDQAYYRVLTPPLPAWQRVRPVATPGGAGNPVPTTGLGPVDHLAAIAPLPVSPLTSGLDERADAIVVALGMDLPGDGPQDIRGVFWDKTDLHLNDGSDIIDLWDSPVRSPARRKRSPLALVSRERAYPATVDLFWIDTANRIATSSAGDIGKDKTTTVPGWSPVKQLIPGPTARAGSPIVAVTLHPRHMGVFVVGPGEQISAAHNSDGTWDGFYDLPGSWPTPVTALAAIARHGVTIEVYWVDGEGAIWAVSTDRIGTWSVPDRIFRPGTARSDSPLAAVARSNEHIDLFWIAPDGSVRSSFFRDTWAEPFPIDGGQLAAPGSGLAAVDGGEAHLQVFWEGSRRAGRALVTTWWGPRPDGADVSWAPPVLATGPGTLRPGTDIVAAARAPGHVRVFFADQLGNAAQTWWGMLP